MSHSRTADHDDELAELVERLSARLRDGGSIDWAAVERDHPAHAAEARRLLPTLQQLAELSGASAGEPGGGHAVPEALGDYRIVREVGRGGMGVVYEAEQLSLGGRRVALKVLPFAAVMDPRHLQRFRNEALAAASLDHPNVVRVHGVGCDRGVHYIAMQFVDGRPLSELIRQRRGEERPTAPAPGPAPTAPLGSGDPTRSFAPDATDDVSRVLPGGTATSRAPADTAYIKRVTEWGIQAAEALEHAHSLGVVHRDVKPGNLLVDGRGQLFVADFGLAKVTADPGVTTAGDVLGTVRYMSPEQAAAKHDLVDHRSDVYSLGVSLYELLTLTPAFPGADRHEVLGRVISAEPVGPRSLDRHIPRDLETVILKALEKNPARRYQSATEFADDLRRFLENKAVRARRAGLVGRAGKWSQRNRALVWAAAAVLLVGVAALAAGTVLIAGAYESEARHRRAAEDAAGEADRARRDALDREASLRVELYATELRQAHEAWENGDPARLRELLDRHRPRPGEVDRRGFEWHYLDACARADGPAGGQTLAGHAFPLLSADLSPDGRLAATSDKGGVVKLWDAASGRELRTARYSKQEVTCVRFSPDGRALATAGQDRTVRLWDVATWAETACIRGHDQTVTSVAWSPNGKWLATGGRDHAVKVWDATTGQVHRSFVGHTDVVRSVAWSPDGKFVASAGSEPGVRLWDVNTKKAAGMLTAAGRADALALAFNPDSRLLAVGGYSQPVFVYDVRRHPSHYHVPSAEYAWSLAFHPEGRYLLVGCNEWSEVWDLVTFPPRRVRAVAAGGRQRAVAFSRDGRTLLTAAEGSRVARVTDTDAVLGYSRVAPPGPWQPVCVDCGLALCEEPSETMSLRRHPGGALVGPLIGLSPALWAGVFSTRGHVLATSTDDGRVQVWDATTGRPTRELTGHPARVPFLAISPDGSLVAGGDESGTATVWRTDTGERVATMRVPGTKHTPVQFAPDGSLLAVANGHEVVLWDVRTWSRRTVLHANQEVNALAFNPDARTLAGSGSTRGVVLWEVEGGRRLAALGEQIGPNRGLAFSPDGRTLATIGTDTSVRLWHVPTRRELFVLCRRTPAAPWLWFESPHRLLVGGSAPAGKSEVLVFPPPDR